MYIYIYIKIFYEFKIVINISLNIINEIGNNFINIKNCFHNSLQLFLFNDKSFNKKRRETLGYWGYPT